MTTQPPSDRADAERQCPSEYVDLPAVDRRCVQEAGHNPPVALHFNRAGLAWSDDEATTVYAAQLVYRAPTTSPGEDWRRRSLRCWVNLAQREEGLAVESTDDGAAGDAATWCGNVRIAGALLAIHRGARPRPITIRTQWTVCDDQWKPAGREEQPAMDPAVFAELVTIAP